MTRTLIRIAVLSLALAALAAPAAVARPDAAAGHADRSGFPTRPVIDRPSAPPSSAPAATPAATPARAIDHGTDWETIGIGLAAGLLAVGAATTIASRTRRTARA